ncbi:MAG: cytidine deaminase [Lachnospiraceae bacterium]|nr:cytidine deaminase [Lachnospiraceae bacterium]
MSNVPENIIRDMINKAIDARKFAYTPYSNFKVGAALLTKEDEIITGCNIENAAYSPGNCGERTAVFKAVSQGIKDFKGIAIVAGKEGGELEYTSPCGMCRQVLREFVNPEEFIVVMAKSESDYKIMTLEELFPMSFGPDNLR